MKTRSVVPGFDFNGLEKELADLIAGKKDDDKVSSKRGVEGFRYVKRKPNQSENENVNVNVNANISLDENDNARDLNETEHVNELNKNIDDLNDNIEDLNENVDGLNDNARDLNEKEHVNGLNENIDDLNDNIEDLNENVNGLNDEAYDLCDLGNWKINMSQKERDLIVEMGPDFNLFYN
ncbi:hypothetical protein LWI29_023550 [Acer saccharum]|uniref:t-SNARE coiled-coil homology domain-containing protein n=1 Tax=Acer saccharum TaxID=4024 RepID=A0AA39S6K4_ACESA|nr:hypothetical protein LWI29_023550 [Acer saccharum]